MYYSDRGLVRYSEKGRVQYSARNIVRPKLRNVKFKMSKYAVFKSENKCINIYRNAKTKTKQYQISWHMPDSC